MRTIQQQTQELLFKTRRLVGDSSPKSRSLMMIYIDSLELFEQIMYTYLDYQNIHKALKNTGMLNRYYGLILELGAGLEYIGITVQMGNSVKRDLNLNARISDLRQLTDQMLRGSTEADRIQSLEALKKILNNIKEITNGINRLIPYTRMEADAGTPFETAQKISRIAATQPISLKVLRQNLTFKSEVFRHAVRLTIAIIAGYLVSIFLSLEHNYWVMLTIVTILRPAYALTKKRNIERVAGTLAGVIIVSGLLWFISDTTVLLVILVLSMLLGYSLLRVHYFTFVVFLTIFLIISLYFLNPYNFSTMIEARLIDTVIGSVIAFFASRFIFPVWGHHEINASMKNMLEANRQYFMQAWTMLKTDKTETPAYGLARQDAIVSLTNLSDKFQRMLAEPKQSNQATLIHQFVIANHMLTGHIAALPDEPLPSPAEIDNLEEMAKAITYALQSAEDNLRHSHARTDLYEAARAFPDNHSLTQLTTIHALAQDIRKITARLSREGKPKTDIADLELKKK